MKRPKLNEAKENQNTVMVFVELDYRAFGKKAMCFVPFLTKIANFRCFFRKTANQTEVAPPNGPLCGIQKSVACKGRGAGAASQVFCGGKLPVDTGLVADWLQRVVVFDGGAVVVFGQRNKRIQA